MRRCRALRTDAPARDESRYVCRIPLAPTPAQRAELQARMRQGRRWYNLVLSEALRRVGHIKANRLHRLLRVAWHHDVRESAKRAKTSEAKAAVASMKAALQAPLRQLQADIPGMPGKGFTTWASLEKELRQLRSTVAPRLGAQAANTIGERAFDAAAAWLFGGHKPRFRAHHEFPSINGNQHLRLSGDRRKLEWVGGLSVALWYRPDDAFVRHALGARVSSIELVSRDGYHFAAHLICEGRAPQRVAAVAGIVGVDPGISFISCVGETSAAKLALPATLSVGKQRHLRRLRRQAQRQKEAAEKSKKRSKGLRRTRRAIARLERQAATARKQATNTIAKRILEHGRTVHLESNSYAAFQRIYGARMKGSRPGALAQRLKQIATVVELDNRLALSQWCICGLKAKKDLSQRTHACPCGARADRDLFSAFLARHVVDGRLDLGAAKAAYPAAQSRLRRGDESAVPTGESSRPHGWGHASVDVVDATSEPLATEIARNGSAIRGGRPAQKVALVRPRPGARRTLATTADSQLILGGALGAPGQPP